MTEKETVGSRIRRARNAKKMSAADLGAHVDRSETWVRDIEKGRRTLDRHSTIDKLSTVLDIDVAYLLGQPYSPSRPNEDAGHTAVPELRKALRRTSLILSGHPGISSTGIAPTVSVLRSEVDRITKKRQAADLQGVMLSLPSITEALNTAALENAHTEVRFAVLGLVVETGHVSRMVLNQLGHHDLAWTAVENSAFAAAKLGDPLMLACSAWDRCGVLLHTGDISETISVAEAAMADLEPMLASPSPQVLSLYGALNLRCSVASSRRHDAVGAWRYLGEADRIAQRLGVDRNDFGTVFGPGNVGIHAAEIAVELDQPDRAITQRVELAKVPSKERVTHHHISMARAYGLRKNDSTAIAELNKGAALAPQYVYNHPLARMLVEEIRSRSGRNRLAVGVGALSRSMGIA